MTTQTKPATPLPWKDGPVFQTDSRALFHTDETRPGKWQRRLDGKGYFEAADAAYISHTANAYPRLVEALKHLFEDAAPDLEYTEKHGVLIEVRDLLRELGELK